ncbi:MAG: hypothetical protein CMF62_11450 [Magnetococcales bacterium]|nr:hypothetical protein [Magnetococcales bacterium]
MPKSTQKCCSKGLMGFAAIGGLVAGAAVAHTFFMCPESQYPACYHDMVKSNFAIFERLNFEATPKWSAETFDVTLSSTIPCPFKAQVRMMVPTKGDDGIIRPVEVYNQTITFEAGKAVLANIPHGDVVSGQDFVLLVQVIENGATAEFDIAKILGGFHTNSNSVIPLQKG